MNLYWVTRGGIYHWTLDCPALRRASLGSIIATDQEPPSMRMLCVSCLNTCNRLPRGYELTEKIPFGSKAWKRIVAAAKFDT